MSKTVADERGGIEGEGKGGGGGEDLPKIYRTGQGGKIEIGRKGKKRGMGGRWRRWKTGGKVKESKGKEGGSNEIRGNETRAKKGGGDSKSAVQAKGDGERDVGNGNEPVRCSGLGWHYREGWGGLEGVEREIRDGIRGGICRR